MSAGAADGASAAARQVAALGNAARRQEYCCGVALRPLRGCRCSARDASVPVLLAERAASSTHGRASRHGTYTPSRPDCRHDECVADDTRRCRGLQGVAAH
eukprot:5020254-Alexandrium_andersonii.AAC.1